MNKLRGISLVLAAVMLFSLCSCGRVESLDIRVDLTGGVDNLDPQFATDKAARTIIANTFETLLRRGESGELLPAAAESYSISADEKTYTFALRKDARWKNGAPVTAEDFVFAFGRLFSPQVPSPYAEEYLMIENSSQILEGSMEASALGVRARDSYTLEIKLVQPSPIFLERLSNTPASPCNQEFFTSTRARYGLTADHLLCNGPYYLHRWDNEKSITISANSSYWNSKETICPSVVFYTTRIVTPDEAEDPGKAKSALELFGEGRSDIYTATAIEREELERYADNLVEVENRVWQIVFNTQKGILASEKVRQAMVMSLDSSGYRERTPDTYHMADSLLPRNARTQSLGKPTLLPWDQDRAKELMREGMEELETDDRSGITIIIPKEAELAQLGGYLQKQLKENLSIYVNMELLPADQYNKRLLGGDFTIAITSAESSDNDPMSILDMLFSNSSSNYGRWASPEYDSLLERALASNSRHQANDYFLKAEQLAIDSAAVCPILTQSGYYGFSKGTSGIRVIGGLLDFSIAKRLA